MKNGKLNICILGHEENRDLFVALYAIASAYRVNYIIPDKNLAEKAEKLGIISKNKRKIDFYISPTSYKVDQYPTLYMEGDEELIPYAENTPKGWYDAIESMILYPEVRYSVLQHQHGG